jgi:CBS domain-containing protein
VQTTTQPLLELTAEDLMSREVITLPRDMPLPDVARVLERFKIGGAPVVNERGQCIGMFSTVDFLRQTQPGNRTAQMPPPVPGCACSEWKIIDYDDWDSFPADSVNHYMTIDPVVVAPTTSLGELAEKMVDAHIHRLIVVDADRRPIGIVSSTDMLAAVARVARAKT